MGRGIDLRTRHLPNNVGVLPSALTLIIYSGCLTMLRSQGRLCLILWMVLPHPVVPLGLYCVLTPQFCWALSSWKSSVLPLPMPWPQDAVISFEIQAEEVMPHCSHILYLQGWHPVTTATACLCGHFRRMGQAAPERSGGGSGRLWGMWGVKAYSSPWQQAPRSGRSSDYFSLSSLAFWVWNGRDFSRSLQGPFGVILPLSCVNRLRPPSVYANLIKWLLSHTCIFLSWKCF